MSFEVSSGTMVTGASDEIEPFAGHGKSATT